MAGTVNKVILIGHTGDEVKMKYFEGGNCIGRFPLATNEEYVNRNTGERVSNTEWHNCVVRNKAAEVCEKYLKKGDKVYIEGRIKNRQWTGEDGQQRYTTEIQVAEFTFLTPKNEASAPSKPMNQAPARPAQQAPSNSQNNAATSNTYSQPAASNSSVNEDDDDLPF
ncbi:single-strand binding protein [Nonlabens dokdonensis]|jgi:single-strand DNA-binding protein|uniref:Single-stranded DNA-binding protein n=2 Tax=Nonlabens dokdonensis TaxID=328515 RepID=L7W8Z0_NONDD|nr:single-stranded DNA-binding protein [Nonlabens dokdonensis]AGC76692.1 single-stranded DNA-binding protein [Nonlabens dokdonensis DSW-6]PZX44340.1 single-strand binding protein [Nonlabens dokdonensis]